MKAVPGNMAITWIWILPAPFKTPLSAGGIHLPIEWEREDLEIIETEHPSRCSTVLLLDISHSMVLYGGNRFIPAKKVALALSELIRRKYPQDSLYAVLFYDRARAIPLHRLLTCEAGPFYTNTKAGLALAQRILSRAQSDNKQIIMITDGKPSAILHEGQVIRRSWWDPWIIHETLMEAEKCHNQGIRINTFMLAEESASHRICAKANPDNQRQSLSHIPGYLRTISAY